MFRENLLKAEMVKNDINVETLSKAINIDSSTFRRKLKRDGDFTRSEIENIRINLGLSGKEADEIFFA